MSEYRPGYEIRAAIREARSSTRASAELPKFAQRMVARFGEKDGAQFIRDMAASERWRMDQMDHLLTNGEGTVNEPDNVEDMDLTIDMYGTFQWVRIYGDDQRGRAIATFYLRFSGEDFSEGGDRFTGMWLARARKGLPPNPLDDVLTSQGGGVYFPDLVGVELSPEAQATVDRVREEHQQIVPDPGSSMGIRGVRPTGAVRMIETPGGDHRWKFPGFKVKSTDLAPVLVKFRLAGVQRIPLQTLRRAIDLQQRGE